MSISQVKSVFFGNGLNLANGAQLNWKNLLEDIAHNVNVDCSYLLNEKKYTMAYEKMIVSPKSDEEMIKKAIIEELEKAQPSHVYRQLAHLRADHYLTTNYEHLLNATFVHEGHKELIEYEEEDVYSIRRHNEITINRAQAIKIWNIHGSIKKYKSLMLGYDHYCGAIGKIDAYLKGTYTWEHRQKSISTMRIDEKLEYGFDDTSWIELFFKSNMHIIGFGMSFDELDIWWLLNRRARMMKNQKIENSIYFYCTELSEAAKSLLQSYDVHVVEYPNHTYKDALEKSFKAIEASSVNHTK
jgi:hypothetical protein